VKKGKGTGKAYVKLEGRNLDVDMVTQLLIESD